MCRKNSKVGWGRKGGTWRTLEEDVWKLRIERDEDLVMVETLKAMSQVLGSKLFLTLWDGNDSSVALTSDLPDLDA